MSQGGRLDFIATERPVLLQGEPALFQGSQMGKSARNEQRRIEAAYLNNVGAGIILLGGFLPVFTIGIMEAPPTSGRIIACAILLVFSWALSRILHKGTHKRASEIED